MVLQNNDDNPKLMQVYKLTHTTYIEEWHYRKEILHSMVYGINKDTPYK